MSESDFSLAAPRRQNSTSTLKDQIADAGADVRQRAGDALRASTNVARDKLKEASDVASEVAESAAEHLQDKAEAQQRSGADFVSRLADTMRQAGHAFDHDVPFAARGINSAADYMEDAAEKISQRNLPRSCCRGLRLRKAPAGCVPRTVRSRWFRSSAFL